MQLGKLRNEAVSNIMSLAPKIVVAVPDQLGNERLEIVRKGARQRFGECRIAVGRSE
jgi:hypothetical protein